MTQRTGPEALSLDGRGLGLGADEGESESFLVEAIE